jgi:hypothetical protein
MSRKYETAEVESLDKLWTRVEAKDLSAVSFEMASSTPTAFERLSAFGPGLQLLR